MRVLVLNPGSATLKATVLEPPERAPSFEHTTDWDGDRDPSAIEDAVERVMDQAGESVDAVGYRVVHGGQRFTTPVLIDDAVLEEIDRLGDLSPLHNPVAAATIRAGRRRSPSIAHVAAFDTAFHATLPEAARRYP